MVILLWRARDDLASKKAERKTVETNYDKTMLEIQTIPIREDKLKGLEAVAMEKSNGFYPSIVQEKIYLELHKILSDCGITSNYAFTPLKVEELAIAIPKTIDTTTSFTEQTKNYESGKSTEKLQTNIANPTLKNAIKSQCVVFGIVVNVTKLTDEQLMKFLEVIEGYDRIIAMPTLTLVPEGEGTGTLQGSIGLTFYSVPKLNPDNGLDEKYNDWELDNTYGKYEIFSKSPSVGNIENEATKNKNDFVAMLKPTKSELSTFRMGKADDKLMETYIYDDKDEVINVTITLTERDGKFYYAYKTDSTSYPVTGDRMFTPNGNDIKIEIISEQRVDTEDKSGAKINIINNTSKKINVVKTNDDSSNPRIVDVSIENKADEK